MFRIDTTRILVGFWIEGGILVVNDRTNGNLNFRAVLFENRPGTTNEGSVPVFALSASALRVAVPTGSVESTPSHTTY
jgi:hypothetical protein